jgi:TIR domain
MTSKVFISYRRDDSKYQAHRIHAAFRRVLPREHVFMDIDSIPPGSNFRKILKDWVNECDVLLALVGAGWLDATDPKTRRRRLDNPSDFVRIEIGEALARHIPVVPVLLDGTPMPDVELLPDDLKELVDRQAEFVEFRTFDPDVERLIKKLRLTGPAPGRMKAASRWMEMSFTARRREPGGERRKIRVSRNWNARARYPEPDRGRRPKSMQRRLIRRCRSSLDRARASAIGSSMASPARCAPRWWWHRPAASPWGHRRASLNALTTKYRSL